MQETANIILFKKVPCPPCQSVLKILKSIAQRSIFESVTIKEIDIMENADIAQIHGVRSVPYVLLNGKTILTIKDLGGIDVLQNQSTEMNENDLFSQIFNKIINAKIEMKQSQSNLLNRAIILSVATDLQTVHRPSLGDFVHIGYLQSIITSLLAQNPASKYYLYTSGYLSGKIGPSQGFLLQNFPGIIGQKGIGNQFNGFLKGLVLLYSGHHPFSKRIGSKLEYHKISNHEATLRLFDSAYVAKNSDIGQDACSFMAGEIAGLTESTFGEVSSVCETKCIGKGDPYCEFSIKLGEEQVHYRLEDLSKQEIFSTSDQLRFDLSLATISQNMYDSILHPMTKPIRPIVGDFIHISVLQQVLLALKFADPFNSALLVNAGKNYGRILKDVGIISRLMTRKHLKFSSPMDFQEACLILVHYFHSPGQILSRILSDVNVEVIDEETAKLLMWECASSAGVNLASLNKSEIFPENYDLQRVGNLDDYMAGFINGRMDLLVEEDIIVQEVKCQSMGHPHCEFYIEY